MKRALPLFGLLLLSSLLHPAHARTSSGDDAAFGPESPPTPPAPPAPAQSPAPSGDDRSADAHQARSVPAFHGIDLAGTLQIDVVPGKPGAIELVGDADLFDKVSTTVVNGILIVQTKFPRDRHTIHMHAIVSAAGINALTISGTGSIKASSLSVPDLALTLSGTGSVKAAGTTNALRVDVNGTGSISARQLTSRSAVVDMSGTGSASVDATDSVVATLSGTGSIDVHGHPAHVTQRKSGQGAIHIR